MGSVYPAYTLQFSEPGEVQQTRGVGRHVVRSRWVSKARLIREHNKLREFAIMKTASLIVTAFAIAMAQPVLAQTVPSRETLTIDCNIGEGAGVIGNDHALMPTETLTVTLLNCDGWNIEDQDAGNVMTLSGTATNDSDISGDTATLVVTGAADIDFDPPANWTVPDTFLEPPDQGFDADIDLDVYLAAPATNPAGSLILERELVFPVSNLPQFTVGSTTTNEADDYLLGEDSDCNMENGHHVYQQFSIGITETGSYSFLVPWVTPVDEDLYWGSAYYPSQDFFLALYSSFNKNAPNSNLLGCNDNRDGGYYLSFGSGNAALIMDDQQPWMTVNLDPGTYTLVLTTYRSISTESHNAGYFSSTSYYADGANDSNWTPTSMSAFFKLWGPNAGSIVPDTDGDGVPDNKDAFPQDATQSVAPVPAIPMPFLIMLSAGFILAGSWRLTRRKLKRR